MGGVMVSSIVQNDPILSQASIQRYAYRALASGLNSYQSAINADPYLAACNTDTNYATSSDNETAGPDPSAQCAGLSYDTWSEVPGTDVGNGVVPEYYKFDNPQQVLNSATNAISYLDVQVVGAAGFGSNIVYYSTVAKFTPANGFLNNVWWSNYESFPSSANGTASQCTYYWSNYSAPAQCDEVYFGPNDSITGPVFTNDSIYVAGSPSFGTNSAVTTADPNCQFVDPDDGYGSTSNCSQAKNEVGTYDKTTSSYGANNYESIPTDNSELGNYAEQNGCYYVGPTTITLTGTTMTVYSPATGSTGNSTYKFGSNTSTCPVNGSASLPANGVIFVAQSTTSVANPFDGTTTTYTCSTSASCAEANGQTCPGNSTCTYNTSQDTSGNGSYYGETGSPGTEGDVFVKGSVSGHLTVGAQNDVIVDGPITYADCTWAGNSSQSNCGYNSSISGTNDVVGLIAYNYVEVDRPLLTTTTTTTTQTCYGGGGHGGGNCQTTTSTSTSQSVAAACGTTNAPAAPLCDPSTSTGSTSPHGSQGLQIDASILALTESFVVNNYALGNADGTLSIYGSIQQDARGPVGTFSCGQTCSIATGYQKDYLWDSRLPLYSPPYYLTPGTASWSLESSSESYTGTCPEQPSVQSTPSSTAPTWPWPTTGSNAGTACTAP
jgi:hypothetical protein